MRFAVGTVKAAGTAMTSAFASARRANKAGKRKIVADGQAELSDRGAVDNDRFAAMRVDVALAPALAGRKVDVEQMDLVVARADFAARVDDERAIGKLASLVRTASDPM
jgi:hypothetical protein